MVGTRQRPPEGPWSNTAKEAVLMAVRMQSSIALAQIWGRSELRNARRSETNWKHNMYAGSVA
jgi:hypothetical protein